MGLQSGGWTLTQQGVTRDSGSQWIKGTTFVTGLRTRGFKVISSDVTSASHSDQSRNEHLEHPFQTAVVVLSDPPYAEGMEDCAHPQVFRDDLESLIWARSRANRVIGVIFSVRPVDLSEIEPVCDALVMAWLPGSAGEGLV